MRPAIPSILVLLALGAAAAAQEPGNSGQSITVQPHRGSGTSAAPGGPSGAANPADRGATSHAPAQPIPSLPDNTPTYPTHRQDTGRGPGLVPSFPKVPPGANPPGTGASVPETGAPGER